MSTFDWLRTWTTKTLKPAGVGALSSAIAVHVYWSRVAQLFRSAEEFHV